MDDSLSWPRIDFSCWNDTYIHFEGSFVSQPLHKLYKRLWPSERAPPLPFKIIIKNSISLAELSFPTLIKYTIPACFEAWWWACKYPQWRTSKECILYKIRLSSVHNLGRRKKGNLNQWRKKGEYRVSVGVRKEVRIFKETIQEIRKKKTPFEDTLSNIKMESVSNSKMESVSNAMRPSNVKIVVNTTPRMVIKLT